MVEEKILVVGSTFEWEELKIIPATAAPSNRNCHASVLYNKYMIIFGGKEGEGRKKFLNDIHILDLEANHWVTQFKVVGSVPEPRMGHSAQPYICKKIVIYGGWNGTQVLDDVNFLKINDENSSMTLEWTNCKLAGDHHKRQFHTANIVDSQMYVFGGGDGRNWLNDLLILDLDTMNWSVKETLGKRPSGRLQHSSGVVNRKLFIFGGEPDRLRQLNDIHSYDVDTNTWSELLPVGQAPNPRVSSSAVVVNNKIFLFGGYDGTSWKNDLNAYSTDDNCWEVVTTSNIPPKNRCRHSAMLYNNNIVIFGGNDSDRSFNDVNILKMHSNLKAEESTLITDLRNMYLDKEYCDVVFVVGKEEIKAHKAILSARCEWLKTMFKSQMMESQTNVIHIHDTIPSVFSAMLEFIYTDEIKITDSIAEELLVVSNKFLITRLKNLCEEYLARKLTVKNIIKMVNLAETHDAQFLKEYGLKFIILNQGIINQTQDIGDLSKEVLVDLFRLQTESKLLQSRSEKQI